MSSKIEPTIASTLTAVHVQLLGGFNRYELSRAEAQCVPAEHVPQSTKGVPKIYKAYQAVWCVIAMKMRRQGYEVGEIKSLIDRGFIEDVMAKRINFILGLRIDGELRANAARTYEDMLRERDLYKQRESAALPLLDIVRAVTHRAKLANETGPRTSGWAEVKAEL